MSIFGWLSILATILLAVILGFALGGVAEGERMDWGFLFSGAVAASLVYTIALDQYLKRPRGECRKPPA